MDPKDLAKELERCKEGKTTKEKKEAFMDGLKRVGSSVLSEQLCKYGLTSDVAFEESGRASTKKRSRDGADAINDSDSESSDVYVDEDEGDGKESITRSSKQKKDSPGKPLGPKDENFGIMSSPQAMVGVVTMDGPIDVLSSAVARNFRTDMDAGAGAQGGVDFAPLPYAWTVPPLHHIWTESLGYKTLVLMDISPTAVIEVSFDPTERLLTFTFEYPAATRLAKIKAICMNHQFNENAIRDLKLRSSIRLPVGLKPLVVLPKPSFFREAGFVTVDFEAEANVATSSSRNSVSMKWG